jgi:DNA-binding GntR family transcriptional regulator
MLKIESIADSARKHLEEQIIQGELRPGQQIKEQEVASSLGISRSPLREAFKILEADGLLRREPRRGVFVSELSSLDIWEIYTLKIALYSLAVTLAMDKMSETHLEKLEGIVGEMETVVSRKKDPDVIRYEELNQLFHETTASIAGHRRLLKMQQSLNNQVKRISFRSFADPNHLRDSSRYHRKILQAIKAKDKEVAERLTREHILKGLAMHQRLSAQEGEPL